MMLAWREITRGKARFASVVAALSLIVFLVLVLGALADGLYYGSTGAVRSTTADGFAFTSDAEGSLVRSRVTKSEVQQVSDTPGVAGAAPLGVLLTGGTGPQGPIDLAVFGFDPGQPGTPLNVVDGRLPEPGETAAAAVDSRLLSDGVGLGSDIFVGGVSATVVGIVEDSAYQLQPTAWTSLATWRDMRDAVRPELRGQPEVVNAVAVALDPGVTSVMLPDGLTYLSAEATGLALPGVAQQKSTLNSIIYTTLAVSTLVVALFFALLVLEKRELFAALKALGSTTARLGVGVVLQAFIASALGVVVGALLARLFGLVIPASVPTLFRTDTLITIGAFAIVAGVIGALFSLRRIAKIDPATAIGGVL